MKYAILNNKKIEPQKGITDAVCPFCGALVIPKCGNVKMHHWAHKTKDNCDSWWENETEWHREWKNLFPSECQEVIMHDDIINEKHVADVRINDSLTIEFQHSPINEKEQYSREQFYKNMIWVVDARKYYSRFKENLHFLNHSKCQKGCFYGYMDIFSRIKYYFPEKWLNSTVPVFFDFGINEHNKNDNDKQKKWLYSIFPKKIESNFNFIVLGMYFTKEEFINMLLNNQFSYNKYEKLLLDEITLKLEKEKKAKEECYKRLLFKQQEEYKMYQKQQFALKFSNEKKWREAIVQLSNMLAQNNINPGNLRINNTSGKIIGNNNVVYNNKKCMVLAIKSVPKIYKNNEYLENTALLLIENNDDIISTLIKIPTYIINGGKSFGFDGILNGKYNYYIRTLTTIPHYDKYCVWFEGEERIWSTKYLDKCLENIQNNYKL